MSKKRGIMNNYGELTPFLKNIIIIASLFISIVIVLIVVYNIVSRDTEIKKAEESVDLNIVKSSVKIDNGLLKLSVSGTLEKLELKKVKFIINDGTNEENVSLDAFNFETQKSFEIDLKKLGIDYTKKITISIKPIIKKLTGEKELKVTDKISLSPSGETKQEEIPAVKEEKISTTITSCDKCGGLLGKGCDKILCHSISEGCYYKGGFTRECASCSEMGCEQYKTQTDCSSNKCKLGSCIWENKECIKNPECGNGIVNASANEECDDGNAINTDTCTNYCKNAICGDGYIRTGTEQCDKGGANGIACTPGYGKTCTYCSSECTSVILTGGTCGDNICTAGSETPASCPADCVGCGDGTCAGGETCNSCSQDCGACYTYSWYNGSWGTCSLTCGGGTQTRTVYCKRNDGTQVADSYCTGTKPDTSQSCNTQACLANGETCTLGTQCVSGFCSDSTCCNTACTGACNTCTTGTCTNLADGATLTGCNDNSKYQKCETGNCVEWVWTWLGCYDSSYCGQQGFGGTGDCSECAQWVFCNPGNENIVNGWHPDRISNPSAGCDLALRTMPASYILCRDYLRTSPDWYTHSAIFKCIKRTAS